MNNEIFKPFLLNSRAQGISGKCKQSTQTLRRGAPRGTGHNAAASA